jgi:ATP synthase protein I
MMTVPNTFGANDESEEREAPIKVLTAQEVQQLVAKQPNQSPWVVVGLQMVVGLVISMVSYGIYSDLLLAASVAYGAIAVIMPTAVFVRGLQRAVRKSGQGSAITNFVVWELAKVLLTVAMLFAAPQLVIGLNWLALVVGFVVTLKVYWLAVWLRPNDPVSAIR